MYLEKYLNGVYTTSGWAEDEDLSSSRGIVKGRWDEKPEEGGVVLYNRNGTLLADGGDECRHVMIVGATGTGKSRLIVMPSLICSLNAKHRRSLVVFDVKGELREATDDIARRNGYKTMNINFRDPASGAAWNPFGDINRLWATNDSDNRNKARKLLEDIIATLFSDGGSTKVDPFWRNTSSAIFRGVCEVLFHYNNRIDLEKVLLLSDSIPADRDDDEACMLYKKAKPIPEAARMLEGFWRGSNLTRGNILTCYKTYLSPLTSRSDVFKMVSSDTYIDFAELGKQPTVLYVTLPDDTTALGALQGMLLTQLMQRLNECAMENGGCLPVRTDLYLDEMCNIKPAIPDLETALTISRSRGMRYVMAIQSYSQLVGVYGMAADTIMANAATWIALNVSKDEVFREKLSCLCGDNVFGKPLITPGQLALLKYGQAVIIRECCPPYFTCLEDIGSSMKRLRKDPITLAG